MTRRALHADVRIRCVQDTTGDRQTESRPPLPALGRDQRLEDPPEKVGGDPFAVVFDPDVDPFSVLLSVDPDVAMLIYSITSVEENVCQNLLQVMKVPAHLGLRDIAHMNRDLFGLQKVFVKGQGRGDQRGNADRFARARPVGNQIEKVIHQRRRAERLLLHFLQ